MGIQSIVTVNISTETTAVTRAGFGTPLVLGQEKANWNGAVRDYETAAQMIQDGFQASDPSVKAVTAILSQNPKVPKVLVAMRGDPETTTIQDDIAAIQESNDDWYGLVLATGTGGEPEEADILAAAERIESMRKIFAATSESSAILDPQSTTDLAAKLKERGYARTFLLYGTPSEFGAAAWLGAMFPGQPGSASWKFKTLRGVSTKTLSPTQQSAARDKNCNLYLTVGGVPITAEGVTSSGEFIDITHGVDWLQARIQEDVFSLLVNSDKIPFTDGGIAQVENVLRGCLAQGVGAGLLAEDPAPTVQVPRARDVPQPERAARHLPDVRFTGILAGAVHSLTINGTVSV